ncbi:hypothetical protein A6R68_13906, partial [Neotoma lepida]
MTLICMALSIPALTVLVLEVFVKHKDIPLSEYYHVHPQQITFGILFTVAVSPVLAKTITVVLAFRITVLGRRTQELLVSKIPKCIIPICTLIQIILCGIWLVISPPFVNIDVHSEHAYIIITCSKGSVIAFY